MKLYTLQEAAEVLAVDPQTVRRWIKAGKLTAYKPGREYRIPESGLEAILVPVVLEGESKNRS